MRVTYSSSSCNSWVNVGLNPPNLRLNRFKLNGIGTPCFWSNSSCKSVNESSWWSVGFWDPGRSNCFNNDWFGFTSFKGLEASPFDPCVLVAADSPLSTLVLIKINLKELITIKWFWYLFFVFFSFVFYLY